MFLGFINTFINLFNSFSNLPVLFYQLLPFLGKMFPPPFLGELIELQSTSFWQSGGDLALINQNYLFYIFVIQIKPVIIKTFNFQFENVSSTKLQKQY